MVSQHRWAQLLLWKREILKECCCLVCSMACHDWWVTWGVRQWPSLTSECGWSRRFLITSGLLKCMAGRNALPKPYWVSLCSVYLLMIYLTISGHVAWNGTLISEEWNLKDVEGSGCGLVWGMWVFACRDWENCKQIFVQIACLWAENGVWDLPYATEEVL
jgi:hypothetical protein